MKFGGICCLLFVYLCVIRLIGDICFSDLKGKSKKVKPKYQNEGSRLSDKPKSREKCFLSSFTFLILYSLFSSVQFSHSIVSNSLRPHGSQHARLPVHHQLPELTQTHVHRVVSLVVFINSRCTCMSKHQAEHFKHVKFVF